MSDEIDEFDEVLTERFRVLERLEPPDVWADAAARAADVGPPRRSRSHRSWRLAAAAALVAVVVGAGLVLRDAGRREDVASPPVTGHDGRALGGVVATPAPVVVPAVTDAPSAAADSTVVDPLTTTTTPPAATVAEYRVIASLIEEPSRPPVAVFGMLDSFPPQGGTGFELVGLDWADVDDAQTAGGTIWADEPFELVGTWDGSRMTLTRPPVPAEWPPAPPIEGQTDDCDRELLMTLAEGVDLDALGIIEVRIDDSGGRCGLAIRSLLVTPELSAALEPLADITTVEAALQPIA